MGMGHLVLSFMPPPPPPPLPPESGPVRRTTQQPAMATVVKTDENPRSCQMKELRMNI